MFRKLRNKFLILNMVVTSLVMLTAFSVVYLTTYNNINKENERKLNSAASSFVMSSSDALNAPGIDPPDLNGTENQPVVSSNKVTSEYSPSFILITDDKGGILNIDSLIDMPEDDYKQAAEIAWNQNSPSIVELSGRKWMHQRVELKITLSENGQPPREETISDKWQISFLDVTETQKTLNDLLFTFLFVGIGMLAVIFCVSIFYANRSINPIAESWEKQKRFVADASHELKTPLTTIMTNCDVLDANEDEIIKSQREWLDYIKAGADRMSKLVSSLLTLARLEDIGIQAEKQPFSINDLISEVIQSMDGVTGAKNLNINQDIMLTGTICGYEESVRQVFTILYENAVKYANENGTVKVTARLIKKQVLCSVKNTGKGIASSDLPLIFDRFYRADNARSNDENSYGLGLSIAKSIAEQIGGKITARSVPCEWTEFVFAFEA